jgi:phage shock protein A
MYLIAMEGKMASLLKKLSTLIEGSLHELVDKAMREKSLAVIDVYIRDAGEGLNELNDAIGTLQANLSGFVREREKLITRSAELDEAINRFLVKNDNSKAQAASAELIHIKGLITMQDQMVSQAEKDLVEQRRGKDILQTKITTMRYEREKMAALLEMAKAKEANLRARQKASDVMGSGDIDMDNLTKSIYGRLDKADALLRESENTLEASIDEAIDSEKVEERRRKLGLTSDKKE